MAPADRGARVAPRWLAMLAAFVASFAFAGPLPTEAPPAPPRVTLRDAPPRIGVMTMAPGEIFWERFGHNALVVVPADGGEPVSYNYGFFDLSEPGFIGNFIDGKMRYMLVALPLAEDLENYRQRGRGVSIQWLDLDPAQATALAAALAHNARPENARYTYDYYDSNCSTRVRDVLDAALGGALKKQLSGRSQGNTYRSESVRLAWPAKWMAVGFDVGLGAFADRPLSRWEEAFIPMRLADSLREARRADGRPLVAAERELLPHRVSLPPPERPDTRLGALVVGASLALLALWGARRHRRATATLALAFWLVSGLAGVLMLYIWFGTAHVAGHGNRNLLLFSPFALALVPGAWAIARGREPGKRFDAWLWVVAGCAALAGFLTFLPPSVQPQRMLDWVLLLLPLHLALARGFARPAALVAARPAG